MTCLNCFYFYFCCSILMKYVFVSGCVFNGVFNYRSNERKLDGTLRCYQCASSKTNALDVCNLKLWKHTNGTEKRQMITQCPRALSAFCHLLVVKGGDRAVRGCSGPRYIDGKLAHIGCFTMDKTNRVCLCNTNLCNTGNSLDPFQSVTIFLLLCICLQLKNN